MPTPALTRAARPTARAQAAHVMLTEPRKRCSRRTRMTRNQPRRNKAPARASQAITLPKLGTALNWVPPKPPAVTKSRAKKRPPAPQ
ncbi:hypothetical protein DF160_04135 [Burkholderia anthina]|nr:hypothetical protein DF160_04135 [Burkholderia anthina]